MVNKMFPPFNVLLVWLKYKSRGIFITLINAFLGVSKRQEKVRRGQSSRVMKAFREL